MLLWSWILFGTGKQPNENSPTKPRSTTLWKGLPHMSASRSNPGHRSHLWRLPSSTPQNLEEAVINFLGYISVNQRHIQGTISFTFFSAQNPPHSLEHWSDNVPAGIILLLQRSLLYSTPKHHVPRNNNRFHQRTTTTFLWSSPDRSVSIETKNCMLYKGSVIFFPICIDTQERLSLFETPSTSHFYNSQLRP